MSESTDWSAAPQPLDSRERLIAVAMAVVVALSRFAAAARSVWDWDEMLFCLALGEFDITRHHPHPPGFPLFVGAAKVARLVIDDDFRALQAVTLISSVLLFPALFFLCRELRLRFTTSIVASLLCCFFPNVWFYGGTAFSDVTSLTLVVAACALLLRGGRSSPALVAGSVLLAFAIGVRAQNLLVGFVPFVIGSWYRARERKRVVVLALLLAAIIVGASYAGAVVATGSWGQFRSAVEWHGNYIRNVDSFLSPTRPPLWHLFDRFFLRQYQWAAGGILVSLLVIGSIVQCIRRREVRPLLALAIFAPFCAFAWLMLDRFTVSRFSIAYAPAFAVLAADGIARLSVWLKQRLDKFSQAAVELSLGLLLAGSFAVWTLPALTQVRATVSPGVEAMSWLRARPDLRAGTLFVSREMAPFVEYFVPGPTATVSDGQALPLRDTGGLLVAEWLTGDPREVAFRRERGRLWNIARRHYFDVSISPIRPAPRFLDGWSGIESTDSGELRRMSGRSAMILPPVPAPAFLRIEGDVTPPGSAVEIRLDGELVGRTTAAGPELTAEYKLLPRAGESHRLEIITPGELVLRRLSWGHRVRK